MGTARRRAADRAATVALVSLLLLHGACRLASWPFRTARTRARERALVAGHRDGPADRPASGDAPRAQAPSVLLRRTAKRLRPLSVRSTTARSYVLRPGGSASHEERGCFHRDAASGRWREVDGLVVVLFDDGHADDAFEMFSASEGPVAFSAASGLWSIEEDR